MNIGQQLVKRNPRMKLCEVLDLIETTSVIEHDEALEVVAFPKNKELKQLGLISRDFKDGFFMQTVQGVMVGVVQEEKKEGFNEDMVELVVFVKDFAEVKARVCSAFYGYPCEKLKMVGVTGTNGKTTITHMIEYLLKVVGKLSVLSGTLYTRWPGVSKFTGYTTAPTEILQKELKSAVDAGCEFGVLEVSSHGLKQKRVNSCDFSVAVFTNLTQDHLDYHGDMEDYFQSKCILFKNLLSGKAIIYNDDDYSKILINELDSSQVWTYSLENTGCDFYTSDLEFTSADIRGKMHTPSKIFSFHLPMLGRFNVLNLLAAVATLTYFEIDVESALVELSQFPVVSGRMEIIEVNPNQDVTVIIDFAHTPDSVEKSLIEARTFTKGDIISVFGCGGGRDQTKRSVMGRAAALYSDYTYITSDNPRLEDPLSIIEEILIGVKQVNCSSYQVEQDRHTAIEQAITNAKPGDCIMILGKGHESSQLVNGKRTHFSDQEEAAKVLNNKFG